jgi:hypothetical protein
MRKSCLIVSFSIWLLIILAPSAFAEMCPSSYVWNGAVGKCQVAPTCASGAYNPTTNRCEKAATPNYACPFGGSATTLASCNTSCTRTGSCAQATTASGYNYCFVQTATVINVLGCRSVSEDGTVLGTVVCPSPLPPCSGISGWEFTYTAYHYMGDPPVRFGYLNKIYRKPYYNWTCSLTGATQYGTSSACTTACTQTSSCTGPTYLCSSGWTVTGSTCYQAASCPLTGALNASTDQCEMPGLIGSYYEYDKIGRIKKIIRN